MKKTMLALLLAAVGQTALADEVDDLLAGAGRPSPISAYAMQIQSAIRSAAPDLSRFQGKSCTLRADLRRDGRIAGMPQKTGDAGLCDVMAAAMLQAQIPPAPDDEVWHKFKELELTFKP